MHYLIALLFVACVAFLHGHPIEHYFKYVGEKSLIAPLRNIDFIYTINLDQRPEKYADCLQRLAPYGIQPHRFSAVNGWELSLEAINDLGVKFREGMAGNRLASRYLLDGNGKPTNTFVNQPGITYFCHGLSRGSIGIVLSHLSILQDAYDSGYATIWVMEDDIEILRDPHLLSDYIEKLDLLVGKEGWDILFTDRDTKGINASQQAVYIPCTSYAWRPNVSPPNPSHFAECIEIGGDFRRIGARYGAYSMIVRRSGMKKLLDFFKHYQIFLPFDMDYIFPEDMHLYTLLNDVVSTQPDAISDNTIPAYKIQ